MDQWTLANFVTSPPLDAGHPSHHMSKESRSALAISAPSRLRATL